MRRSMHLGQQYAKGYVPIAAIRETRRYPRLVEAAELSQLEADRVIRKGVVEYLQLASSYEAQRQYERDVPEFVDVPAEVIEIWADYFPTDVREHVFTEAFTSDEARAIRDFHGTWLAVTETVRKRQRATSNGRHGTLVEVQELREWDELRLAAETALRCFSGV